MESAFTEAMTHGRISLKETKCVKPHIWPMVKSGITADSESAVVGSNPTGPDYARVI